MSLRLVVYAEGALETGVPHGPRTPPGNELQDDELGAAHILVRRCLSANGRLPDAAIRFHRPLRTDAGRVARGSDFLKVARLRKLLSWPPSPNRPDLAVVLVDADGDRSRKGTLDAGTAMVPGARLGRVIGVAIEEFEAWLVADDRAVSEGLHATFPTPKAPETMAPQEAKLLLAEAIALAGADPQVVRRTIAEKCGLDAISARCPSFADFRAELVQTTLPATFGR